MSAHPLRFALLLGAILGCTPPFLTPGNPTPQASGTWIGTAEIVTVYDSQGHGYPALAIAEARGPVLPGERLRKDQPRPVPLLLADSRSLVVVPPGSFKAGEEISVSGRLGEGGGLFAPSSGPGHAVMVSRCRGEDGSLRIDNPLRCSSVELHH